jgi:hypothetical protein
MLIKFSKKASDIEQEDGVRLIEDLQKVKERIGSKELIEGRIRKNCIICAKHLTGDSFSYF